MKQHKQWKEENSFEHLFMDLSKFAESQGFSLSDDALMLLEQSFDHFCKMFSDDLVAFARHAKRKTLSPQDVLLFCRKNPALLEKLHQLIQSSKEPSK
ncbi:hypothetical protein GEMRC1_007004 [Eukaryota sp. GEM-RC1]